MTNKVIERAIELLEQYGWTKGVYARDKDLNPTNSYGQDACSFCALGALGRAAHELDLDNTIPEFLVAKYLPVSFSVNIAAYNDDDRTTKEDIIALFRKANEHSPI